MIIEKILELPLKLQKEEELNDYLDISYSIFMNEVSSKQVNKVIKKFDSNTLSNLIRFYRLVNINSKIDEDSLKDLFKGKSSSLENIKDKIKEILLIQSTRINFSDYDNNQFIKATDSNKSIKKTDSSIKILTDFKWKVNLIISNSELNKILVPQIILTFEFSDGSSLKTLVSMKIFQEIRKNLTLHIKRIIENEHVNLLHN